MVAVFVTLLLFILPTCFVVVVVFSWILSLRYFVDDKRNALFISDWNEWCCDEGSTKLKLRVYMCVCVCLQRRKWLCAVVIAMTNIHTNSNNTRRGSFNVKYSNFWFAKLSFACFPSGLDATSADHHGVLSAGQVVYVFIFIRSFFFCIFFWNCAGVTYLFRWFFPQIVNFDFILWSF